MKLLISTSAGVKLPAHVVGASYWQSASSRLDYNLAALCKKAGTYVTFVDSPRQGYDGVVVSKKALTEKDIKFLEDNWEDLVEF